MAYFVSILNHSLSAYRAGYSCQHGIFQLTEFWRQSLDKGNCVGTVAMDLSKPFDSMSHGLLIAKLSAYGVSKHARNLIINFLCNRHKKTKVMGKCSEWVTINRGVLLVLHRKNKRGNCPSWTRRHDATDAQLRSQLVLRLYGPSSGHPE